jgi:signal transduction histidine kinase
LVLAATGVLMSWLLNRGLAPLRDLASGAAQVSVTSWDFSPPESARMTKELTPLIAALESVLLGLKRSFEQQKRFVSDAAHELKTSVAVVKSSLQLLQMKQRTTEEYEAGLERCLSDCARMEQMVAQMLMLARVEEDKVSESLNLRADVRLCVEEVTGRLGAMAESNRTSIVTRCHESFIARVDSELFKLLCINLLTNALQHSPPDSIITVDIRRLGDLAEMRVSDNGDGIAPEDLPHVFERFFRSDPSRSRRTGGTGLGLAICTAIADKFNGSIEITSKLNEGTTVLVRFPLANSAEADSTAPHR